MRVREANKLRGDALRKAALENDKKQEMTSKCLEDLLQVSFEMDLAIEKGQPVPVVQLISWLDRMNIALIVELTGRYDQWEKHQIQKEGVETNATEKGLVKKDDPAKH